MKPIMSRKEALRRIKSNSDRIRAFGVKRVALFGSYARDENSSSSDVDILVEFEKGQKTFDNYMDLKFFLESMFGRKVDLVLKDAIKPALERSIMDGAVYAA
jgi:predicted nucleotidyltransferase